jgi:[ribosomal protein S5]-alanine N-acetyltransferase
MKFPVLKTQRLKLVEITHNHIESLYEVLSLEEVTKYYGTDPFTSHGEAIKLIDLFQKLYFEKRGIRWGIVLKHNYKLIGTLGLNNLQLNNKRAEIGYEIHPQYWRNGFTTEAIKEVLRYGYEELDLFRIGAVVYPENEASLNLLNKFGFSNEGLLRSYMYQNNQLYDTYVLSLLRTEWNKNQEK